jgi:hypothetical protein
MLTIGLARRPIREDRRREVGRSKARRAMEQAEIDRIRRVLHRRPKPPWRLLWRGRPLHLPAGGRRMGPWARRRLELQAGWQLLWDERLRRNLAPIYQFVACRRGRHRDAQVMADDLIGSDLGDAYPEVAICEVCGRAVHWPNGVPNLQGRGPE